MPNEFYCHGLQSSYWSFHFNSNDQCSPSGSMTRSRIPYILYYHETCIRLFTVTRLATWVLHLTNMLHYAWDGRMHRGHLQSSKLAMIVVHFSYKRLKDTDKSLNFPGIKLEPDFIDICNLIERREAGTSYAIRFTVNYDARNFQTF